MWENCNLSCKKSVSSLLINKAQRSIDRYVTDYDKEDDRGRALGTEIYAPDLEQYMMLPYDQFTAEDSNFNYDLGTLLT